MIRRIIRSINAIISTFSPKLGSEFYYFLKLKKKLNLENPITFNEKLMKIKLTEYVNNELVSQCADKYKVREYLLENNCGEILNPLYNVYNSANEIDFSTLPSSYVFKCNHAAGFNIICDENSKINESKIRKQLRKWMLIDYWKYVAEVQYKSIEKKITCEKLLKNKDGSSLNDYKIYCFHGKPLFCMICVDRDTNQPKYYFMDKDWKLLKINKSSVELDDDFTILKPKNMDKMYEYAEKLSKPFTFVRVDFYDVDGEVIFGEMTFTPAGCVDANYTDEGQEWIANQISLEGK